MSLRFGIFGVVIEFIYNFFYDFHVQETLKVQIINQVRLPVLGKTLNIISVVNNSAPPPEESSCYKLVLESCRGIPSWQVKDGSNGGGVQELWEAQILKQLGTLSEVISCRAGFLNLSTADSLDRINLCCVCVC